VSAVRYRGTSPVPRRHLRGPRSPDRTEDSGKRLPATSRTRQRDSSPVVPSPVLPFERNSDTGCSLDLQGLDWRTTTLGVGPKRCGQWSSRLRIVPLAPSLQVTWHGMDAEIGDSVNPCSPREDRLHVNLREPRRHHAIGCPTEREARQLQHELTNEVAINSKPRQAYIAQR
jgi:hypothetical protein